MSMPGPSAACAPFAPTPVNPTSTAVARERRNVVAREGLRQRVAAEFNEMPGLRLTLPQAWRLFGLRSDVCLRLLMELSDGGVLRRTPDGQFALRDTRQ